MYFALPSLLCFQNVSDFIIRNLVLFHPLCFPCLFRFSRIGHRGQGSPAFCSLLHPGRQPHTPPTHAGSSESLGEYGSYTALFLSWA